MIDSIEYDTPYKDTFFKEIPTCALVEELQKREGVLFQMYGPDESYKLTGSGPTIILIVVD